MTSRERAEALVCRDGADQERAAIVAWLRKRSESAGLIRGIAAESFADAIERGEHRK